MNLMNLTSPLQYFINATAETKSRITIFMTKYFDIVGTTVANLTKYKDNMFFKSSSVMWM